MQQELSALCRLIENSAFDRGAREKGGILNFFNDGVVEKDFLSTGLGVMLAKSYFDELKADLDQRLKKIHHFRPYAHPHLPQVSAEAAWARFSPGLLERLRALKARSDSSTTETLALMSQLYLDQATVPPDVLRQILMMQQNQAGVAPDPVLANSDLTLFGFTSMEDWFGPRFVSLIAQFILNAAQIAEERGYEVKIEEVRANLFQNIYQGYQQISRSTSLAPEEADRYFQMKMRALGLDETTLISTWKKVMLFRRLFEDGSGSVLIDPLAYQQFEGFARETMRIALYPLPSSLQLTDFRSLLKFQLYVEAIALDSSRLRADLRLPSQVALLEQIEKKVPELIQRQIEIEWSSVSKAKLCMAISVKETWEWETSDEHWEMLNKNFPEIAVVSAHTRQLRHLALNKADEKLRTKIDQFARAKMVEEQPEKIKLALEDASMSTSSVGLKGKGGVFPFPGIKEGAEFTALLERASLRGEAPNAASEQLAYYSSDGDCFYRIQVVRRDNTKKVLTYAEAARDGTLEKLLDKKLEEAYPDARRKNSHYFQQSSGQWKPFKEVKDQIGRHLFSDLLKTIEDNYRAHFGLLPGKEGELPFSFYCNARFLAFMKDAQVALKSNPEDPAWVRLGGQEADLASQWLLEKDDQTIERCTKVPFSKDEMFTLNPQQWSEVKVGEKGMLAFYFVQERNLSSILPLDSVEQGHQILSHDAKRDMMSQVLGRIHLKKAIDLFSVVSEERL
jgi:GcvH upstream region-like protein